MKKKLLMLLVVAVAASLFAMAWTGAWFAQTISQCPLDMSTGTLEVKLSCETIKVENLEPGADYERAAELEVENIGDYKVKLGITFDGLDDEKGLADKVLVRCVDEDGVEVMTPHYLAHLAGGAVALYGSSMNPGEKARYTLQVALAASAGNSLQNAKCGAKIIVKATQVINPGWDE